MAFPSSSSGMPSLPLDMQEWILQGRVLDKEFIVCFDDNNRPTIKELPIDVRGVPLMDLEVSSSKDEQGCEWVKDLGEMDWTNEEVCLTIPDHS